jgi:hypothetical protein
LCPSVIFFSYITDTPRNGKAYHPHPCPSSAKLGLFHFKKRGGTMVQLQRLLFLLILALGLYLGPHNLPVDNNDGTVTDDRGLIWLQSPYDGVGTWDEASEWADSLIFAGKDDWRLPSALDFDTGIPDLLWNSENNEFGYLYMVSLGNPHTGPVNIAPLGEYYWGNYWTSTEDPGNSTKAAAFFWSYDGFGLIQMHPKAAELQYTAVRGMAPPERAPECSDTYDNDGDGAVDFPADWGCLSSGGVSEAPMCFELFGRTLCIRWVPLFIAAAALIIASYYGYKKWRSPF